MSDKFRRTEPVNITFGEGEEPTHAKLNAITKQSRNGSQLLEKALGDIWNQSGDSMLSNLPLQIPNLARALGQQKYMNPALYPPPTNSAGNTLFTYYDNIGTRFTNQTEGWLLFKPSASLTVTGGTAFSSLKTNETDIAAAGDYWVDTSTGRFRCFSALSSSDKVKYTVDYSGWDVTSSTLPSVIPDPRQSKFTSCRISKTGGTYYLHLPPRFPLTFSGFQSPSQYPPSTALSDNESTDTTTDAGNSSRLWQASSITASTNSFYRYSLPNEVLSLVAALSTGDQLPDGYLYLWNQNTGTIIEGITFKKQGTYGSYALEVVSSTVNLDPYVTSSETEATYSATGLSLICVGSSVSNSIYSLRNSLYSNNYSGTLLPVPQHSRLLGVNPYHNGSNYPSTLPPWKASFWPQDDHTHLLSRGGSYGTSGAKRDIHDNGMLGDLLLCSTGSTSNYLNLTSDSNRIYFGSRDSGPSMYHAAGSNKRINVDGEFYVVATDTNSTALVTTGVGSGDGINATGGATGSGALLTGGATGGYGAWIQSTGTYPGIHAVANGTSGQGIDAYGAGNNSGVRGTGGSSDGNGGNFLGGGTNGAGAKGTGVGTGYGLWGLAVDGYGVRAESDTSAALHIVPQDTNPSSPATGNFYVNSSTGKLAGYSQAAVWERYVPQSFALTGIPSGSSTGVPTGCTFSLPANLLTVGSTIRVIVTWASLDTAASGNSIYLVRWNSTTLGSVTVPNDSSTDLWVHQLEITATVTATGSSATTVLSSRSTSGIDGNAMTVKLGSTISFSADTTATNTIDFRVSSCNNTSFTVYNMIIQVT